MDQWLDLELCSIAYNWKVENFTQKSESDISWIVSSWLFTLINSLRLLSHNLVSFGSFAFFWIAFTAQSNYNFQTLNKYTKNKAKQNYDYDFMSSNANSYELWTTLRHEIKQKRKLEKKQ